MSVNRRWIAAACALLAGCGAGDAPSAPEGASTTPVEVPAPQLDDATYLYRLGLMRGHLFVGNALFEHGETMAAGTHSKHPTDELYAPMATEFAARGSAGFAAHLDAHAAAVAAGDEDEVAQRYTELLAAIADNEAVVDASPRLAADIIVRLVVEAAEEYAIGIVDGKPANAHEYQDAYGFTQVAIQWARRAAASDSDAKPHGCPSRRARRDVAGVGAPGRGPLCRVEALRRRSRPRNPGVGSRPLGTAEPIRGLDRVARQKPVSSCSTNRPRRDASR